MENSQKYHKRRKSITEFRSSYSDNKNYFISTDKKSLAQPILKYTLIVLVCFFIALGTFLITDALLTISEEPYSPENITVKDDEKNIDKKYFENIVTKPADEIKDTDGE